MSEIIGNNQESFSNGQMLSQVTAGRIFHLKEDNVRLLGLCARAKQNNSDITFVVLSIYTVEKDYPKDLIYSQSLPIILDDEYKWRITSKPEQDVILPAGDYFLAFHTYSTDLNSKILHEYDVVIDDKKSFVVSDNSLYPSATFPLNAFYWKTSPNTMVNPCIFMFYSKQR